MTYINKYTTINSNIKLFNALLNDMIFVLLILGDYIQYKLNIIELLKSTENIYIIIYLLNRI